MLYTPQVQGHTHLHDSLEAATSNPEMKQEVCVLFLPFTPHTLTPTHPHMLLYSHLSVEGSYLIWRTMYIAVYSIRHAET